jgi:hypothetical protein
MVEAQHHISTMKLVDNADEQRTLEELLDRSKPPVPVECRDHHWLLFTPFRYDAGSDSRFRRAGRTPGVFYAAEAVETSVAEIAFWRLLFFIESPATPWPSNPLELTAFQARYATQLCIDLTIPPYDTRRAEWTHATDYTACHQLADEARAMGANTVRSISARDPAGGINISLLSCAAFAEREPRQYQSWRMKISPSGIYARCEAPVMALEYGVEAFGRDPRIAAFNWSH